MIRAAQFQQDLNLECLVPSTKEEWDIRTPDLNRPGMQFCGFYEYFAFERPQVLGKVEMAYLERQTAEDRMQLLRRYFTYHIPCIIICRGMVPPPELLTAAREQDVPVYRSCMVTTRFTMMAINYLNRCLAPYTNCHGVLVDVYGVGVLLTGNSGVGKSEAALELIKRGHQLVADDQVDLYRMSEERLIGTCPDRLRYLMEIRGIGIINVKEMFGIGAISGSKSIELVLELERWQEPTECERLGLEEHYTELLGVKIPYQKLPIMPGRNLAIIVEVAARNHSLKKLGYNAAQEMLQRMQQSQITDP